MSELLEPLKGSREEFVQRVQAQRADRQPAPSAEPEPEDETAPPADAAEDSEEPAEAEDADDSASDEAGGAEAEDAEDEPEELPPLTPPASMSEADRNAFTTLSREAQEWLVEREKAVRQQLSKRGEELTELRKTVEAERQKYAEGLEDLHTALGEEPPHSKAELDRLKEEDPTEWVVAKQRNQDWKERRDTVSQERAEALNANFREALDGFQKRLPEVIPEWSDETTMSAEGAEVGKYLIQAGYPQEAVARIVDPIAVGIARKAMLYDRLQASKAKATKKVNKAPRMQTPGTPKPKAAPAEDVLRKAQARLKKRGDVNSLVDFMRARRAAAASRR